MTNQQALTQHKNIQTFIERLESQSDGLCEATQSYTQSYIGKLVRQQLRLLPLISPNSEA